MTPLFDLITIREASEWASKFLDRKVSESNISYLVQYGKIKKHGNNDSALVNLDDLKKYYLSFHGKRELDWKKLLGDDLNWTLSFDHLREKDTTKHVHRLHPYKGKYIPQLVEYFLDSHTDDYKKRIYFKKGDVVLDPFSGSGTTLVQANEIGLHSIGIDISRFNSLIAEVKLLDYDLNLLNEEVTRIREKIAKFETSINLSRFETELLDLLAQFNRKYFPSPEFKYKLQNGHIDERTVALEKEKEFFETYNDLIKKFSIKLKGDSQTSFLDKWYIKNIKDEIDFAFSLIKQIKDKSNKKILAVILSRTIRSCRATTHSDLATLKEPQITTYYCYKHKKICRPLFSIKSWFDRYAIDTLDRLKTFSSLKTTTHWITITADSRTVDLFKKIAERNTVFSAILKSQKIKGIFTSPPYVGQIDYHEQHAYAYDLFGFKRQDDLEIGPLYKGQGIEARKSYIKGVSEVLLNCKKYLAKNYDVFLVANDKYNLYPHIAEKSGMKIVDRFKRPVLNRTERDRNPYSEIIFHFKSNSLWR